jgi:hypothetical protein
MFLHKFVQSLTVFFVLILVAQVFANMAGIPPYDLLTLLQVQTGVSVVAALLYARFL